ncbi:MAG: glycosyl hydrolase-related protein, partial [Clostridia bacterium]|nr:glycosyl hydrolase-related protein [Clostridia bacterium]
PEISNMKLMSYGYGDGGGGPSYSMLESEKIIKDMVGMPKLESTTVSAFMNRLEKTAKNLPTYSGELYLELHRGTLTQMHNIKRSNRLLEKAIRNYELLSVLQGKENDQLLTDSIKILLTNQFHDILPGTCLADAHDVAIYENTKATEDLYNGMQAQFENSAEKTVFNPLSWDRDGQVLFDADFTPENCVAQKITNVYGETYTAVSGLKLPALSVSAVKSGTPKSAESPFKVDGDHISTPFADIVLEKGAIKSYQTKQGVEVVADATAPLNTFYFGEDIPIVWDNWDIDYDQPRKMKPIAECLSSEVVACGPLQLRVRVTYKIDDSALSQDIVFYADTPRIDFESVVDWKTPHSLLKTGFKVNVLSNDARFEVQFGNVKRPTHENFGTDKSQFEVCNHKWTDLSDTRFGVAILNDCKYGISVDGNDMRLTLHKGGCRPDTRGDQGVHRFTYSLLVHESGFSAESVIRPAYELNYPAPVFDGTLAGAQNGSLLSADAENVIVEAVKPSEDGNGYIVRLYEAEGSHANCMVKVNATAVAETNMLEMEDKPLAVENGAVNLQFRPFEIKTLRVNK